MQQAHSFNLFLKSIIEILRKWFRNRYLLIFKKKYTVLAGHWQFFFPQKIPKRQSLNSGLGIFAIVITILSFIMGFSACNPPDPEKQLLGKWIGYYRHNIFAQPFPIVLTFREDGTASQFDAENGACDVQWDWMQDVLRVDTTDYYVSKISETFLEVKVDERKYVFKKIIENAHSKFPLEKQFDLIFNNYWSTRDEYIYDNDLGVIEKCFFRKNILYKEKKHYLGRDSIFTNQECERMTIMQNDDQLYFSQSDLFKGYDTTFYNIMPITFEDENNFVVTQYKQKKAFTKRYSKSTKFEIQDSIFYKCKETYIQPYFSTDLKYNNDKPAIRKHFQDIINKQYAATDNGYIGVLFVVNCEGKIGDFELQLSDFEFRKTDFSIELVRDLLEKFQTLDDWKIGRKHDDKTKKVDSRKYLMFKFEKGKFVDLLP